MLRLSRRQLLKTTAISTALAATPQSVLAASREKLTIPPLKQNVVAQLSLIWKKLAIS